MQGKAETMPIFIFLFFQLIQLINRLLKRWYIDVERKMVIIRQRYDFLHNFAPRF
jgi:hypothetical protein